MVVLGVVPAGGMNAAGMNDRRCRRAPGGL